jgi:hypothetical protein
MAGATCGDGRPLAFGASPFSHASSSALSGACSALRANFNERRAEHLVSVNSPVARSLTERPGLLIGKECHGRSRLSRGRGFVILTGGWVAFKRRVCRRSYYRVLLDGQQQCLIGGIYDAAKWSPTESAVELIAFKPVSVEATLTLIAKDRPIAIRAFRSVGP